MSKIKYIVKRDGSRVKFNPTKIQIAISKAMDAQGITNEEIAEEICCQVVVKLEESEIEEPSVEEIQDIVEGALIARNYVDIAKAYIIYRHEHNKKRYEKNNKECKNFIKNIIKRTGEIVPFDEEKILVAIQRASSNQENMEASPEELCKEVIYVLNDTCPPWETPSVEEIQDIVEKVLIKNNLVDIAKSYILYREEHARKRNQKQRGRKDFIPYKKLWETLWFGVDNKCENIKKMNLYAQNNQIIDLIKLSEERIDLEANNIVKSIQKRNNCKLIFVNGPVCSGKHSLAQKILQIFSSQGKSIKIFDVDELFENNNHQKHISDIQIPSIEVINEIKKNILDLLMGKNVVVNSKQLYFSPQKEIFLLIDGYSISKQLKHLLEKMDSFTVYVEALSQMKNNGNLLRWTDIRLCRAMMRDKKNGKDIANTIENWHYIRRREMQYIIPSIVEADVIINSFTIYELFLMKQELFTSFNEWQKNIHSRYLSEFSSTIMRIHQMLEVIDNPQENIVVPENSLLQQFVK